MIVEKDLKVIKAIKELKDFTKKVKYSKYYNIKPYRTPLNELIKDLIFQGDITMQEIPEKYPAVSAYLDTQYSPDCGATYYIELSEEDLKNATISEEEVTDKTINGDIIKMTYKNVKEIDTSKIRIPNVFTILPKVKVGLNTYMQVKPGRSFGLKNEYMLCEDPKIISLNVETISQENIIYRELLQFFKTFIFNHVSPPQIDDFDTKKEDYIKFLFIIAELSEIRKRAPHCLKYMAKNIAKSQIGYMVKNISEDLIDQISDRAATPIILDESSITLKNDEIITEVEGKCFSYDNKDYMFTSDIKLFLRYSN